MLPVSLVPRVCVRFPVCSSIVVALIFATAPAARVAAADELNALVWCNHTDEAFIEPFEQAHGVTVNLKEFEGTGAALSIIEQSRPGDWDVLIIDGVDVPRLVEAGVLGEIPTDTLPLDDMWPEVLLEDKNVVDGKTYGVTELFGYNTIAYDRAAVDPEDMQDMRNLWNGKYEGRIAVYDWALPMIGLVGMGLGKETASLGIEDMPEIRETLAALGENAAQFTDVVASQTALATGEVDILFGGGEWLTAVLSEEMPNLDWTLPAEGGLLWTMSATRFADTERPELALKFIEHIMSPEGQAALATSSCYWSTPANRKAGELLSEEQRRALRWGDQADYLARSQLYPEPGGELEEAMEDAWIEMQQR